MEEQDAGIVNGEVIRGGGNDHHAGSGFGGANGAKVEPRDEGGRSGSDRGTVGGESSSEHRV